MTIFIGSDVAGQRLKDVVKHFRCKEKRLDCRFNISSCTRSTKER